MASAPGIKPFGRTAANSWAGTRSALADPRDELPPALDIDWHVVRLPAAPSKATICGCRSSVREIDGNSNINAQPSATTPETAHAREPERQRKSQTLVKTIEMLSQRRLRLSSIRYGTSVRWSGRSEGNCIPNRQVLSSEGIAARLGINLHGPSFPKIRVGFTGLVSAYNDELKNHRAGDPNLSPWAGIDHQLPYYYCACGAGKALPLVIGGWLGGSDCPAELPNPKALSVSASEWIAPGLPFG
jgi:hypothetical protein